VYTSGRDLDEEQDVDTSQQDRVDTEEVAGEHATGLSTNEFAPGRPVAARRRFEAAASKGTPNGRRGRNDPDFQELADNPLIAPTWILSRKADDQLARLRLDRRAAGADGANDARRDPGANAATSRASRVDDRDDRVE
jgi:hypothetical protein